MRQSAERFSAAAAALLTAAITFTGTVVPRGPAFAEDAPPSPTNTSNQDIAFSSDIGGCGARRGWEMCVYFQQGLDSIARVLPDGSEQARGDGSLRISTPGPDDKILLEHFHGTGRERGPLLADFDSGGFLIQVLAGEAPTYSVVFACPSSTGGTGYDETRMVYAGPYPRPGEGWQAVDVTQDGAARWQVPGVASPLTLDEAKADCPDATVLNHAFAQDDPGADARIDSVRFGSETVNFWIPPLVRVKGHSGTEQTSETVGERLRASEVAKLTFSSVTAGEAGDADATWVFPARSREALPPPKAAVVAAQDSFPSVLVAGPLSVAVRGPLLVNPRGGLRSQTLAALADLREGSKVYLVGDSDQLGRKVAQAIRSQGLRPVRVAGSTPYETATRAARLIDRRRPPGVAITYVLASATRPADSLAASAAAGASHGAVLLTRGATMPAATDEYIDGHRSSQVFAVGRDASRAVPGLRRNHQIFGADRYVTAVRVAEKFFPAPRSAVFGPGRNPVDALLAGTLAARTGRPLLLVAPDVVPRADLRYLEANPELRESVLVADFPAVSEAVFDELVQLLRVR